VVSDKVEVISDNNDHITRNEGSIAQLTPEPRSAAAIVQDTTPHVGPKAGTSKAPLANKKSGGLRALEILRFDNNQSSLSSESQARFNKLIPLLTRETTTNIEIHAHADNTGSQEDDPPLSQRQADMLHQLLIDNGVAASKIITIGRRKHEPITGNNSEAGHAENRRIEITFTVGNERLASGKIDRLHFASKTFGITEYSTNLITFYVSRLARFPDANILIKTHTDNIGPAAQNLSLSEQRANEVKAIFIEKGIPAQRIQAIGMGETMPVADNRTRKGRNKNRRAELYLQLNLE